MNEWRDDVSSFVLENGLSTNVVVRFQALVSEVGELAKEVLKGTDYGKQTFLPTPGWSMELGDVLFQSAHGRVFLVDIIAARGALHE